MIVTLCTGVRTSQLVYAAWNLAFVVVRTSMIFDVIFVFGFRRHALLIVVVRMIIINSVMTFHGHFGRRHRTVDARYWLEHFFQRDRIETYTTVLCIFDSHVVRTLALWFTPVMIVVDDIKYIAVLHFELRIVRRFGMVQLLLSHRFVLQRSTSLGSLRFQRFTLSTSVLLGRTVLVFDSSLRRYRRPFFFGAVNLSINKKHVCRYFSYNAAKKWLFSKILLINRSHGE